MSVLMPDHKPLKRVREWMIDRVPIRQRLALWYVTLVGLTLCLFSVIVYTTAETQLQGSISNDIQNRAVAISRALQKVAETSINQPGGPFGGSSTPTSTITPTPTPDPTVTPSHDASPTPVPTADPRTAENIQKIIQVQVPDLLGRLDINFEVLGADAKPQYYTPALVGTGLPINNSAIAAGLAGVPSSYKMYKQSGKASLLLEVYVQPIALTSPVPTPSATADQSTPANQATTATGAAATPPQRVVGVVLVAKGLDDTNSTLATLARLLILGDLIAVVFAYVGGWLIARSGLRPIADVTQAARSIAATAHGPGLGTRVNYRGVQDDVGTLVSTFNDMLAAIERVTNAQRRFVADASHELRAPLMTIKGSLELLRRAPDLPEEERRAMIQDSFAEAERMAGLVSDLLLLARVDAVASGTYGLHESWLDEQLRGRRERIELDQLVMGIFRQGRSQLRAKRKDLSLIVTNLEPITVMGDPGQLRQAALILLDNAIKYTPPGGKIRISATRNGELAAVSITDNGIGIDPADRPHIFERFYRADRARERDEYGSGLGLSIAKWIADAHRGDISVHSQPGQGSTFTLLLPALPGAQRAEDTRPSTAIRVPKAGAPADVAENGHGPIHAIYPLARLARSVSRPRSGGNGGKGNGSNGKGNGNSANGKGGAKHASSSRMAKPKSKR